MLVVNICQQCNTTCCGCKEDILCSTAGTVYNNCGAVADNSGTTTAVGDNTVAATLVAPFVNKVPNSG